MKPNTARPSDILHRDQPDFSLVLGGPLFQLLRRAHLSDDALVLLRQRILVISLCLLAAAPGALGSGRARCWAEVWPCPSCWTWRFMSGSWWRCPC